MQPPRITPTARRRGEAGAAVFEAAGADAFRLVNNTSGQKNAIEKMRRSAPTQRASGPSGEMKDWAVPAVPQRRAAKAASRAPWRAVEECMGV